MAIFPPWSSPEPPLPGVPIGVGVGVDDAVLDVGGSAPVVMVIISVAVEPSLEVRVTTSEEVGSEVGSSLVVVCSELEDGGVDVGSGDDVVSSALVEDGTSEDDDGASELESGVSDEEDGVGSGLLVSSVEESGSGEDEVSPAGGGVLVGAGGGVDDGVSPGSVRDVGSGPGVPSVPELDMMRCL